MIRNIIYAFNTVHISLIVMYFYYLLLLLFIVELLNIIFKEKVN